MKSIFVDLKYVTDNTSRIEPLYFDTESTGLYQKITLAQFYQGDDVMLVQSPDIMELVELVCSSYCILQNASYDLSTLQAHHPRFTVPHRFEDTLLLGKLHFWEKSKFSLDELMTYVLGINPYAKEGLHKKDMQKTDWSGVLTPEQIIYASIDVYYLKDVYETVMDKQDTVSYRLDKDTLITCLEFQNKGFPYIEDIRAKQLKANNYDLSRLSVPINVNSYKQVRAYIGEEESDALALSTFSILGNDRASDVLKAKKLTKQNSYLKKFDVESKEGRIFGKFSPSTRSGRLSCKDQNLQQIPRKLHGVFGYSEDDDRVMVYSDFSQLELRTACAKIGEYKMAELFYSGEDLHTYTEDRVVTMLEGKEGRQVAKTCNFNLLYGGSPPMLGSILISSAGIYLDDQTLVDLKSKWLSLWPSIRAWQKQGIRDWNANRPGVTALGRKYIGKLMTDQLNIEIQGTGAEVAKIAMYRMAQKFKEFPNVFLMNFMHDSYHIECPNNPEIYSRVADIVAEAMHSAWSIVSQKMTIKDIPMPIKVYVGKNWGTIEDEPIYMLTK